MTAFGVIAALLVIAQLVAFVQWRDVQDNVALLEGNALTSIRLVQRMGLDVQRQRILIDRHIFEHDSAAMRELEQRLATAGNDFASAATEYAPSPPFPVRLSRGRS